MNAQKGSEQQELSAAGRSNSDCVHGSSIAEAHTAGKAMMRYENCREGAKLKC